MKDKTLPLGSQAENDEHRQKIIRIGVRERAYWQVLATPAAMKFGSKSAKL
jgi:hypothetical protein